MIKIVAYSNILYGFPVLKKNSEIILFI